MTTEQIIGLILALLLMGVGLVGSLVPVLPGLPLILLVAVGHRLVFGAASIGDVGLLLLTVLTAVALLMDYLATLIGARKLGATWWGLAGALIGAVAGLFFALPGVVLGPFLGATLLELLSGREFEAAVKAGMGAVIGLVCGAVAKLACSAAMMGVFTFDVIRRSLQTAGVE
jgi:uncharacterized protein YqgC (DUF456 family)